MLHRKTPLLFLFLAAFLMLGGCSGKEVAEYLSVDRQRIEAGPDMDMYSLKVESNCDWTVTVRSTSGQPIKWILPTVSNGHGNASVGLRVYKNNLSSARNAEIVVSSPGTDPCVAILNQSGQKTVSVQIRVGSFNIRIPQASDEAGGNGWEPRKPRLAQAILENGFDVFGLQECSPLQQSELPDLTKGVYEYWFFSPYAQNGVGKSAQGIAFKKDKFTLTERNFFWACKTPETMTTNDTGDNGTFNRGGCCAVLTHKETGVQLFVMNTHACLNRDPRDAFAYVYADMEKKFNTKQLPSVFVGDMNASYSQESSATYRKWWKDSYDALATSGKISGPAGTYNGFNLERDMATASRIDYVYYRGSLEPLHYSCNAKKYGGYYPSDHLPIYCDFNVTNNN